MLLTDDLWDHADDAAATATKDSSLVFAATIGVESSVQIDDCCNCCTMHVELNGHLKPCVTDIYIRIDARVAD